MLIAGKCADNVEFFARSQSSVSSAYIIITYNTFALEPAHTVVLSQVLQTKISTDEIVIRVCVENCWVM